MNKVWTLVFKCGTQWRTTSRGERGNTVRFVSKKSKKGETHLSLVSEECREGGGGGDGPESRDRGRNIQGRREAIIEGADLKSLVTFPSSLTKVAGEKKYGRDAPVRGRPNAVQLKKKNPDEVEGGLGSRLE